MILHIENFKSKIRERNLVIDHSFFVEENRGIFSNKNHHISPPLHDRKYTHTHTHTHTQREYSREEREGLTATVRAL